MHHVLIVVRIAVIYLLITANLELNKEALSQKLFMHIAI